VQSVDYENERLPSLETQRPSRHQTEEKVLPEQAVVQEMPGRFPKVRKAERTGIRGEQLMKVFKRDRRS